MTCADCGEASSRSCLYSPESRSSESVCRSSSRTVPYISDLRLIKDYLARDGITNGRGNYAGVDLARRRAASVEGAFHLSHRCSASPPPRPPALPPPAPARRDLVTAVTTTPSVNHERGARSGRARCEDIRTIRDVRIFSQW